MEFQFIYSEKEIARAQLNSSLVLGRSMSCDVQFPSLSHISKQHAQLLKDQHGHIYIVDLGSTHGVYVNGNKLEAGKETRINPGMDISLCQQGKVKIVFLNYRDKRRDHGFPLPDSRYPTVEEILRSKEEVVIGRASTCDIVLNHASVSRNHLSIKRSSVPGVYLLNDLKSLNGTYMNGVRITGIVKVTVKDTIHAGRFKIALAQGVSQNNPDIAIVAKGISKKFGEHKFGLRRCSFEIPSNSLTAIMGPSGCGKSTLLKALNGVSPPTSGEVLIAGVELTQNFDYIKTQIGYVPQDDIVHHELTVEECLWYSAKLRLQRTEDEEIREKIMSVMSELRITKIKGDKVGAISGGQRKRVAIACEILTDPQILFLDEPTSPLDPQTIEEFLSILKNLAAKGTAVVMVTHKPEDLAYMNSVIFLAEGGFKVYQGAADGYLKFFKQENTVEVYAQLAGENAKRWVKDKQQDEVNFQVSQPKSLKSHGDVDFFKQYWWLTNRYMNIKLNDRVNTFIMLAQAPFIALLVNLIFDKITPAVIFIIAVSSIWFGANNAAREIVYESAIYKRERMFNLGILPYIFSKLTVLSLFSMVQSFLFSLIMVGSFHSAEPNWSDRLVENFGAICLISMVATMMGLLLSALSNTTEKVMTIVPITLIPQLMLAGLMTPIVNSQTELLSYLTISRWGNELLSLTQEEVVVSYKVQPSVSSGPGGTEPTSTEGMEGEMIVNAGDNLYYNHFHQETYEDIFGDWVGTLDLDITMLMVLFGVFFWLTHHIMKSKDSIRIK